MIDANRCRPNAGVFLEVAGLELAVFRLTDLDRVMVTDNTCPHSGGNLSAGSVEDGCVTCPLHDWRFSLTTGVCTDSDLARVRCYPTEVRDGVVWADLPS